jgi:hypothetical protein
MSEAPFTDDHDSQAQRDEQILLEAQSVVADAYAQIVRERQERELAKSKRDQPLSQLVPLNPQTRIRLLLSSSHEWLFAKFSYFKRS